MGKRAFALLIWAVSEADLCSWSSNGEQSWLRNSGPTPSSSTGPEQAAEGTWYVYTEATSTFDKAGP